MAPFSKKFSVADAMQPAVYTVDTRDTIDDVARLFSQNRIHSAPVIDDRGTCVGIFTSSDLATYEAVRNEREQVLQRGIEFDLARYGSGDSQLSKGSFQFNEVGYHMTREFQTVTCDLELGVAAEIMWRQSLHHLLVLDDHRKPLAILSSLDVLGFLVQQSMEGIE